MNSLYNATLYNVAATAMHIIERIERWIESLLIYGDSSDPICASKSADRRQTWTAAVRS
jgi:hypothetical protein